jgi:uncharacterized YigZ family protein
MTKNSSQLIHSYFTIKGEATGLYKEKGSKFLAFAFPVSSEQQIKENLEALRKKYFDARHHCYAWVLGPAKKRYRASDDGEPNHSAGDPILGQIRARNLTDTLVVVVRYFGGTKLGVGGLMMAYKVAAEDALSQAEVEEREVLSRVGIRYTYASTPDVMKWVKEFEMKVVNQKFEEECSLEAQLPIRRRDEFITSSDLLRALGSSIVIEWLD